MRSKLIVSAISPRLVCFRKSKFSPFSSTTVCRPPVQPGSGATPEKPFAERAQGSSTFGLKPGSMSRREVSTKRSVTGWLTKGSSGVALTASVTQRLPGASFTTSKGKGRIGRFAPR
ncbi:MAG: hypothetical protein R3F20_07550 [Planctomycetota bacterium]